MAKRRKGKGKVQTVATIHDPTGLMPDHVMEVVVRVVRRLARKVPLRKVVRVRVRKTPGKHGWAQEGRRELEIALAPTLCVHCARETVVHEWAHLVFGTQEDHKDTWGIAYARCYRASL